jgi:hypothetical protein
MLSVSGVISRGEDERLRAVGRPLGFIVELASIPDDLH